MKEVFDVLRSLKNASNLRLGRNLNAAFTSRLIRASRQKSLIEMVESLAETMDSSVIFVGGGRFAPFMAVNGTPEAKMILSWIRKNPRVASMICFLGEEDYLTTIEEIKLTVKLDDLIEEDRVHPNLIPKYDIPLEVSLLSPLAHGDDIKAGNAQLFRRRAILGMNGSTMNLPYYAGNALRGTLRDLLADHFLSSLGLSTSRAEPVLQLWFFHALYAGGVLQEGGNDVKKINASLGNHGAINADGIRVFRDTLPHLSLLGAAMGNKILAGRIQVGDLRPRCVEWSNGNNYAHDLLDWVFITRKDNFEGSKSEDGKDDTVVQMIADTEVLKEGVMMRGGIDHDGHIQELELSALGMGLELLKRNGKIGGKTREGLGKVAVEIENQPDPVPYLNYLNENKQSILDYLQAIGALL